MLQFGEAMVGANNIILTCMTKRQALYVVGIGLAFSLPRRGNLWVILLVQRGD